MDRFRHSFGVVAVLLVAASLVSVQVGEARAQDDPTAKPAPTDPPPPDERGDDLTSSEPVVVSGSEVDIDNGEEAVSERTEDSKTYATDTEGVYRTEIYADPVSFEDPATGEWVDIDATLVSDGDRIGTTATPVEVSIAADAADESLVEVRFPAGQSAGFGLDDALPVDATVEDSTATFAEIVVGADLSLEATGTGVKELLILDSPDTPRVCQVLCVSS